MDQSGGVLPRNGLAENKLRMGVTTAIGGEGGTPVPAERVAEYFADAREAGHQHQLRQLLQRDAGAHRRARQHRRARRRRRARPDAAIMDTAMRGGAMGMTTALIYPPSELRDDRRIGGDGEGRPRSTAACTRATFATKARKSSQSVNEAIAIGERARTAGRDLPPQGRVPAGLGHADGRGAADGRRGARARRRRRRRPVRLHGRRHGPRGDDSRAGRTRAATTRSRRGSPIPTIRARLKREIVDGLAGLVEHHRGGRRLGRRRARQRAQPGQREVRAARRIAQIAKEMGKDPADAAWDLVAQGKGRVMAIYHMMSEPDIETALRFPWTSIGSDAGAVGADRRPGSRPGLPHPRSLRQLSARDRALRAASAACSR